MNHFVVHLKLTQFCNSVILQFKKKLIDVKEDIAKSGIETFKPPFSIISEIIRQKSARLENNSTKIYANRS